MEIGYEFLQTHHLPGIERDSKARTYNLKPVKLLGPCKRTQQVTTLLRVVGVFGQQCCVRLHGPKSLTGFKLYVTSANIVVIPCKRTQRVRPNSVECCWPTMLRPFAWALRQGKLHVPRALYHVPLFDWKNMCLFYL